AEAGRRGEAGERLRLHAGEVGPAGAAHPPQGPGPRRRRGRAAQLHRPARGGAHRRREGPRPRDSRQRHADAEGPLMGTVYLRGSTWWLGFVGKDGRWHYRSAKTTDEREARATLAAIEEELR